MVLVDTSVWVTHLRKNEARLYHLLEEGAVSVHPFIVGELACGNLKNRKTIFQYLSYLPKVKQAQEEEVLGFLEVHELYGRGLAYVDVHLLVSAILSHTPLWTFDKELQTLARQFKISYI